MREFNEIDVWGFLAISLHLTGYIPTKTGGSVLVIDAVGVVA